MHRSSLKAVMPPAPGQDEPLKRITKIVNSLIANKDCIPFREPVDWRGLGLWDYPEIITQMMDLGTIKRRLERGHYSTAHQVAEDIRLVWRNCMQYNADGSDFWLLAKSYARRFEDRYRKIRQEYDVGETPTPTGGGGKSSKASRSASPNFTIASPSTYSSGIGLVPPTLDARARFASNLFLLSGIELGYVLTTCELCPEALAHGNDPSKIEINVDEIPADMFATLNTYVTSKVGNKNMSSSSPGSDSHGGSGNRKRKRNNRPETR